MRARVCALCLRVCVVCVSVPRPRTPRGAYRVSTHLHGRELGQGLRVGVCQLHDLMPTMIRPHDNAAVAHGHVAGRAVVAVQGKAQTCE